MIEPDSLNVENDLSLIAVIGQGMGATIGTFEVILYPLAKAKIRVRMIDQGADDLNIILGVSDADYEKAMKFLYEYIIQSKENW